MRTNGKWMLCDDNVVRPGVQGLVKVAVGNWAEVTFLLDAGADRTVFSAQFLHLLQPFEMDESEQIRLAGVSGAINSITIETVISFRKDDGQLITVRGQFGVFTEAESADLSVLGRHVTQNSQSNTRIPRLRMQAI